MLKALQLMSLKDRGNQYFKTGHYENALQCYELYIDEDPSADKKVAYSNISFCHFKLKQYKQSIEAADNSIEEDQTYAKAYYRKMHAYKQMGGSDYDVYINAQLLLRYSPEMEQKNKLEATAILKQYRSKWLQQINQDCIQVPQDPSMFDPLGQDHMSEQPSYPRTLDDWLRRWQQEDSLQQKWEEVEDVIVADQQFGFNLAFLFLNQLNPPHYHLVSQKIKDTQNTLSTKMDIENVQQPEDMQSEEKQLREHQEDSKQSSSSDQNLFQSSHSPTPQQHIATSSQQQQHIVASSQQQYLQTNSQQHLAASIQQQHPAVKNQLSDKQHSNGVEKVQSAQSETLNLHNPPTIQNHIQPEDPPNNPQAQQQQRASSQLSTVCPAEESGQQVELNYQKLTYKLKDSRDVMVDLLRIVQQILVCNQAVQTKRRLLDLIKQRWQKEVKLMKSGFSKQEQNKVKQLLVANGMESYIVDFANKHAILK